MAFVSGGPCSGKTKLVEELERRGYPVFHEAARRLAETDERFKGKNINQIDRRLFQDEIFSMQKKLFGESLKSGNFFFSDRGFGDTIAYYKLNGFGVPQFYLKHARSFSKHQVFVLDLLSKYKMDALRRENSEERETIHAEIIKVYTELGNPLAKVPEMKITDRADFILEFLGKTPQSKSL